MGEVLEAQTVKFHLGQDLSQLGSRVQTQGETADEKRFRFRQFLIRDRRFTNVLYLRQDALDRLVRGFRARLKVDPELTRHQPGIEMAHDSIDQALFVANRIHEP